ncbi:protein extra-macrochaetae [Teleopsis dalmanni]|uniref:protein extra-macrochaetae n=1 Tax=Teleopsis dalmanni TaxID=139649 RepID=UPI0018CF3BA6|nr:protein extra-macrochaetae [Teleopsis dalmanni]
MKSFAAVCQTGATMPAINPSGRIARPSHQRGDGENAEMKMYLSKLKDLVPFMPKNRKLSKLEIIQHVIDYICELQSELEAHSDISTFDTSNFNNVNQMQSNGIYDEEILTERLSPIVEPSLHNQQQHSSPTPRQPLVDRHTPNTILPVTNNIQSSTLITQQQLQLQQQQQQQVSLQHQQATTSRSSPTHSSLEKDSRQSC